MTIQAPRPLTRIKRLYAGYNQHVLPLLIDKVCGLPSMRQQRQDIVPKASGVVLEVGIGTGLNARFYDQQAVTKVIGIDPHLHPLAQQRFEAQGIALISQPLSAETIPLMDSSVDSIVMTYTLCSIPDPNKALQEMIRVLKPNGKLYYAEHGLAPAPKVITTLQKTITPAWRPVAGGCHLDRDIEALLVQAGFKVVGQQGFVQGISIVGYYYWGQATINA